MPASSHRGDDFTIYATRGRHVSKQLRIQQTVRNETTGELETSAANLSSGSVRVVGKRSWADSTALFDLTNGAGVTVLDAAAGIIQFDVPADRTASLPANSETRVKLECIYIDTDGEPWTLQKGEMVVTPGG